MTHERVALPTVFRDADAIEAAAIAARQRVGVVEGVNVDFRHPDLTEEWEASPYWFQWGKPPHRAGLLFPGEHDVDERDLRALRRTPDSVPIIRVYPGDSLTIDRVEARVIDRRFDHPHDKTVMLAHLRIRRASGEAERVPSPLGFFGASQVRDASIAMIFDHVALRIAALNQAPSLDDPDWDLMLPATGGDYWNGTLEAWAFASAREALGEFHNIREFLGGDTHPDNANRLMVQKLRTVINCAAMAGFLQAKAESREAEAAAIERARELEAKSAGGRTRRKHTDEDRYEEVREMVERSGISQQRACELVAARMGVATSTVKNSFYKVKKLSKR